MESHNYDSSSGALVDIQAIPDPYRTIFSSYPSLNQVQSSVFHDVIYTDQSITVAAPTGSGKTAIFELAIVRQLIAIENSKYCNIFKMVYISPMKALCEERLIDWHKKFSPYGVNCISITGDSEYIDFHSLSNHNLIITTPEKWDSITRKWKDNKSFMQVVKLFMIDEIHLLNEENRGATLEALVCRMKTIQGTVLDDLDEGSIYLKRNIRFLAASATFPNIKDVGQWLCDAKYFSFDSNTRPVKLNTIVLGYPYSNSTSPFKFDMTMNYKLPGLILKYSNGKPTLIFCSTRKSVEMAVKHLTMTLTIPFNDNQKETLIKASSSIKDAKLKEGLLHGIGYHHGGLLPEARAVIEQLFRAGVLPVLITTSTLATGVNLPAHLVIVKSTKYYDKGGFQDYTAISMLQMLGRAGRPQFDTEATALILTTTADKDKFEHMTHGRKDIESNLHRHLTEHLNAEIVLGTITHIDVAMRWLSSTFLYIRARQNPRHYGISLGLTSDKIDRKLLEICQIDLNKLVKAEMATIDDDINIQPTKLGELMAKYYMSFETIKLFKTLTGNEILQQILSIISKCQEFSDMRLRVDEKKCLNLLNKNKNKHSIRFPFNGKIKTIDMKINCTIQAIFGCLEIEDHSILSEAYRIMRLGERICRCLIEYWKDKSKCYSALVNTILLWKCFRAQLWENSPHIAKQFPGIGLITSNLLVNAGKTTLIQIINTNPREIELITKKKPPFGNKVIDIAKTIPRYDMKLEKISQGSQCLLKIALNLLNPECLQETPVVQADDIMSLLIGDNQNNILLYERYMHSHMLENNQVVKLIPFEEDIEEIRSHFISENIVGIDLTESITMKFTEGKTAKDKTAITKNLKIPNNKTHDSPYKKLDDKYAKFVQTYIDCYMKCKKSVSQTVGEKFLSPKNTSIKPNLNDTKNNHTIISTPEQLSNIDNSAIVEAVEKPTHASNEKNAALCNTHYEARNFTKTSDNYYNLTSYDECDEMAQNIPCIKDISNKTSDKESLTDEEIAEHVDAILSEHLMKETTAQVDSAENSDEINQTTKEQVDKGLLQLDLDNDLPSLYEKYGMQQRNEKLKGDDNTPSSGIYIPCNELSNTKKNAQQKGKIHSAGSFEDALFNPNSDSLKGYRYKPSKRLSHNASEDLCLSQSKRRKSETLKDKMSDDMMKNLDKYIEPSEKESPYAKSIKWRSPLVYSPPVKYSPKISTSFSFSIPLPKNSESESSHDWSMTTDDANTSLRKFRTLRPGVTPTRGNVKPKAQTQTSKFLLADKEYEKEESSEKYGSPNQIQKSFTVQSPRNSLQFNDVFSSSFLEDVGLSKQPTVNSNLQNFNQKHNSKHDLEMNFGTYFHDIISKNSQLQSSSTYPSHQNLEARAPFFLKQINSNENTPKSENMIRKSEIIPGNNYITNPKFIQNERCSLPQNLYQPSQENASLCSSANIGTLYPSNKQQYYKTPQNFEMLGQHRRDIPPLLPISANDSTLLPSTSCFESATYFSNAAKNRFALEELSRSGCSRTFHESANFSGHKENHFRSNDLFAGQFEQFYPQQQYRQPLNTLDKNVTLARNSEFLNDSIFIPNGGSNFQPRELRNVNNFVDDSTQQEYRNQNIYRPFYSSKDMTCVNPQNTLRTSAHDGFFLNANQSVSGPRRYVDETYSICNNVCSHHRLLNCPVCKERPLPFSLDGRINQQEYNNSVGHTVETESGPVLFTSDQRLGGKPSSKHWVYQNDETNDFHRVGTYNESYLSQLNQRVKPCNTLQGNCNRIEDNISNDPPFFHNDPSMVSQRNIGGLENNNTQFTRDLRTSVDMPHQQNNNTQLGSKAFILDKFLYSAEKSQ